MFATRQPCSRLAPIFRECVFSTRFFAVKTTGKALSTRCFKCLRVGHNANKCQKKKSLVTLEKIETEREKEDPLPIFDDYAHEPKEGSGGEQNCGHKEGSSSIHKPDRTQDLRTNLFEEEGNDVLQSTDHYMEPAQHGVHDVLNISTEPTHSFFLWWLALDRGYIKSHSASRDDPFNPS
uniref:CCHC-type domain-containing protein n=1 Tax=Brassica oleracea var. oleracea TaxID=109376 RepID=A0A0D3DK65_BRAOL